MDKYLGKRLDGRYEIHELIGIGGMANVYRCTDTVDDREVAIKILKDEFLNNEDFIRRFKNESKAIAMLSHPNIVKVYDVSFGDMIQYIVMEYIDGITLKEYIERQGVIEWKETLYLVTQVLRALQHAHESGIVHRDIKPQNIMLLQDGTIKVTDFGIARFSDRATRTMTDQAIGSVHYIAPEQARGDVTDGKTDIYSVGVMLYEMLAGRLPFDGDSAVTVALMQLNSTPMRPREINPAIPVGLEQITMRAMEKDPDERYASAAEMLSDMDRFRLNPSIVFDYGTSFVDDQPTKFVETDAEKEEKKLEKKNEKREKKENKAAARRQRREERREERRARRAAAAAAAAALAAQEAAKADQTADGEQTPSADAQEPLDTAAESTAAAEETAAQAAEQSDVIETAQTLPEADALDALLEEEKEAAEEADAQAANAAEGAEGAEGAEAADSGDDMPLIVETPVKKERKPKKEKKAKEPSDKKKKQDDADFDDTAVKEHGNGYYAFKGILIAAVAMCLVFVIFAVIMALTSNQAKDVVIPSFVGRSIIDVKEDNPADFRFEVKSRYDDSQAMGVVLAQDPAEGMTVKTGSTVLLTVNSNDDEIAVPFFNSNFKSKEVASKLRELSLIPELVTVGSDKVPKDYVIGTFPVAGAKTPIGSTVYIYVSNGERAETVEIPAVLGENVDEAQSKLEALGLTVETIPDNESREPKDTVVGVSPLPHGKVEAGTVVMLTVSTGVNERNKVTLKFDLPAGATKEMEMTVLVNGETDDEKSRTVYPTEEKTVTLTFSGTGVKRIIVQLDDKPYREYLVDFNKNTVSTTTHDFVVTTEAPTEYVEPVVTEYVDPYAGSGEVPYEGYDPALGY